MITVSYRTPSTRDINVRGMTGRLAGVANRGSYKHFILNTDDPHHYCGVLAALKSQFGSLEGAFNSCPEPQA